MMIIARVLSPPSQNSLHLSARPLWSLRYLRHWWLPAPFVVFAIAAAVAGKRKHRKFFGVASGTDPFTRVSPRRGKALRSRRPKVGKVNLLARRLKGHREQLVLLARRRRWPLAFTPRGGRPAHFVGMVILVRMMGTKGISPASLRGRSSIAGFTLHVLRWPRIPVITV